MLEVEITDISCDESRCENECYKNYIDKIDSCTEYNNFFENFLVNNTPCIIKNVSFPWECSSKWVRNNNEINYEYLEEKYGDLEAPVANCDTLTFDSQSKVTMSVKDYVHYLKNSQRDHLLYLKDWHLKRLRPRDNFYDVPKLFSSDWLNEYAVDNKEDDFMFVYIGPKNSWTPLHADVYSSFSWSVNVVGQKKWILFPPHEERKLKDKFGNLPLLFDPHKFENIKYFEITQEKGDAIFVPSGWYHQVVNNLDTISINHNWINACNLIVVWDALNMNLISVENEIKEFKDTPEFDSQCQLILKSLFGMNFQDFIRFCTYIGDKRLRQLTENITGFYNYQLSTNHIKFDLSRILKVMEMIDSHALFSKDYFTPSIKGTFVETKHSISKYFKRNK